MAKNWSAYEAAKEIYGNNKENIAEIGSRFPLFARTVALADSVYLLDILKALPTKVTARVVETGLKEMETEEPEMEIPQEEEAPKKGKAKEQEDEWSDDEEEESTYESMTAKDLYSLCCKRGISSLCKSRKKDELIKLLEKLDNGEIEPSKGKGKAKEEKKTTSKKDVKKEEPVEEEDDDWGEDEEETDPYVGKTAMELFKMCKERGLKVKPKQKPDVYANMLKADDAKGEEDTEEEDDDDWEI